MKALIHRYAPPRVVNLVWNLASDIKDLPQRLRHKRPRPWRTIHNVGGGDFFRTGERFFERFRAGVDLQSDAQVLDLGCGAGRLAGPICAYLGEAGSYTGFDISANALDFARRTVTGRCNIRFVHAPLSNGEYRRSGGSASAYRFPAGDASVDVALATSLFSHLMADVTQAYLAECGRVLKPGGRVMLTAFLVDGIARQAFASGAARQSMQPIEGQAYAVDPRHPERAIGFDECAFLSWAKNGGLELEGDIQRGNWRDQGSAASEFQDRLVLIRKDF